MSQLSQLAPVSSGDIHPVGITLPQFGQVDVNLQTGALERDGNIIHQGPRNNQGPGHALPSLDGMGIHPQRLPLIPSLDEQGIHPQRLPPPKLDESGIPPQRLPVPGVTSVLYPATLRNDANMLRKLDGGLPAYRAYMVRDVVEKLAELQRQATKNKDQAPRRQGPTLPLPQQIGNVLGQISATVQTGSSLVRAAEGRDMSQPASTLPTPSPTQDTNDTIMDGAEEEKSPSTVARDGHGETTAEAAETLVALQAGLQSAPVQK
ncbi:uncharacterized protein PAC_06910 [Phialocephala subalpina]|uniref:Uncharacterized protein n=1 Tax=Phialocephala subalpina TaxID=576137 RepID=A0A1L7WW68_9HELO|nr:uncharacterized protein PAC_06910 [Phialocephala subalpina]